MYGNPTYYSSADVKRNKQAAAHHEPAAYLDPVKSSADDYETYTMMNVYEQPHMVICTLLHTYLTTMKQLILLPVMTMKFTWMRNILIVNQSMRILVTLKKTFMNGLNREGFLSLIQKLSGRQLVNFSYAPMHVYGHYSYNVLIFHHSYQHKRVHYFHMLPLFLHLSCILLMVLLINISVYYTTAFHRLASYSLDYLLPKR